MKKGKILKVRMGHEANCSSGMILLVMLFGSAITYLPAAAITGGVQVKETERDGYVSEKTQRGSQIGGLIITIGMFLLGVTSGYSASFLGMAALILGAGYAIAVHTGKNLAPKIGNWNILVVPIIQILLVIGVYMLFSF